MTTTDVIIIVVVGRPDVGTVIVHRPHPNPREDVIRRTMPASSPFSKLSAHTASATAPARPPRSPTTAPATFPAIVVVVKVIVIVIVADISPLIC